jgi:hypothetical protein
MVAMMIEKGDGEIAHRGFTVIKYHETRLHVKLEYQVANSPVHGWQLGACLRQGERKP